MEKRFNIHSRRPETFIDFSPSIVALISSRIRASILFLRKLRCVTLAPNILGPMNKVGRHKDTIRAKCHSTTNIKIRLLKANKKLKIRTGTPRPITDSTATRSFENLDNKSPDE